MGAVPTADSWAQQGPTKQVLLPVNKDNGKDGGSNVDGTNNGCVQKGGVLAVSKNIEQLGSIEHDGVDSSELLEEGDQDRANLQ